MSLRLRRIPDPTAEAGRHYETPDGRFQVHRQENAEYFDQPDREPYTPTHLWDIYENDELCESVRLLRHARVYIGQFYDLR